MSQPRHSEAAFETVIETHLLANGYVAVNLDGFNREGAVFPGTMLAFIRATQPKEWVNLDAQRQNAPLPCSRSAEPPSSPRP
jgi:type I restriction enzyme R subunit